MVKKIHYCWFGGKKLPKSVEDCIKTWKKFLPDYEIKQWDESNFDVNSFPFVKEAYESKKWAFVSDYVRIYALYEEGGLYLDTDVKILKDPTDVLNQEMVLGYEDSGYVGTAMIYVKNPHSKYIKEILDYYGKIKHFEPEIMYNFANPVIITKTLKQYQSVVNEKGIRIFDNNIYVYPRDYFYPINYNYSEKVYTKNTCMVHLFKATWTDNGEKRTIGIYRTFGPGFGKTLNSIIDGIFNFRNSIVATLKKMYNWTRMKASIYVTRNRRVGRISNEIKQISKEYITICHPEMPVEKSKIANLFEGSILELREQYTKKEAEMIANAIVASEKKQVIFNQYADGWDMLISSLKKQKATIKIKIIIHNGQDDLTDSIIWNNFDTILGMYDKGIIDELVFLKRELYEFYKEKGYRVKLLSKYIEIDNKQEYKIQEEKTENTPIKIGLYEAYDTTSKNIYNQLCAVSLLENAKVDCSPVNYKISKIARFFNINLTVANKLMTKPELYKKLANNDINLCANTIDENSMLPYESLELGTICLVGNSFKAFEGSKLQEYLVVENTDNILEIKAKILEAIENKEKILEEYKNWSIKNKKEAQENLKNMLEN